MISDVNYGTIVQRVRKAVPKEYARLKRLSPKFRKQLLDRALATLATFPPDVQAAARQIIDRETARGVPYSGMGSGAVSTAANVATIIGTIGQIGLSIYSLTENKKAQKRADARAAADQQMQEKLLQEQMLSIRQSRDIQKKQADQVIAAQQAEIDAIERVSKAQQEQPAGAQQPSASSSNKGLLIAGGVAAAAVAAVALTKG